MSQWQNWVQDPGLLIPSAVFFLLTSLYWFPFIFGFVVVSQLAASLNPNPMDTFLSLAHLTSQQSVRCDKHFSSSKFHFPWIVRYSSLLDFAVSLDFSCKFHYDLLSLGLSFKCCGVSGFCPLSSFVTPQLSFIDLIQCHVFNYPLIDPRAYWLCPNFYR